MPVTAAMIGGLARIKLRGHQRQRAPRIADPHERYSLRQWRIRPPFGQDRNRAGGDGGLDETQPVGFAAFNRHENVAGFDRAAVGRHAADIESGMAGLDFGVGGQNLAKLHGGSLQSMIRK